MKSAPLRLAIVGMGKIAHDQHLPAIAANADIALAATVDPHSAGADGIPNFPDLATLLAEGPAIEAVALCTPPQFRYGIAVQALDAGLHVLLEKPPGASLAEVEDLHGRASVGVSLFATWHSRFASGVAPAKEWLADKDIRSVSISWREDVRTWHPDQAWIWEPGGLGVFDPGINALSIITEILPRALMLDSATLTVPENRAAPIAAKLLLRDVSGVPVMAEFDWRQTGEQAWDIVVETDQGEMTLNRGGAVFGVPDGHFDFEDEEYPSIYERFLALIRNGESDVDIAPFRLVADAFLLGHREATAPFFD